MGRPKRRTFFQRKFLQLERLEDRLAPSAGISTSNVQLVTNGGFETGNLSGWTFTPAVSGSDFYVGSTSGEGTHSGNYDANFGAVTRNFDSISQSLATTPGQSYTLSYWLSHDSSNSANGFQVSWGGTVIQSFTSANSFGWTNYTFNETATSSSTVIQFSGYEIPAWWGLDDVSVQGSAPVSTATSLAFGTQPGDTRVGTTISPAVTVNVLDQNGHLLTSDNSSVTVSLYLGSTLDNGDLVGTATVNAANGVATFSDLSVASAGTGYTLVASDGSLATATSNSLTISNPAPTTTGLDPATANEGNTGITLTVNGTNFVPSSTVQWNGASLATTYVSAGQLQANVPDADLSGPGTASVTVVNSGPGGGTSNPQTFTITDQVPTGISLDNTSIAETAASGTVVGHLSTVDPDGPAQPADTFTYAIVGGDSTDFAIQGSQLVTGASFDVDTQSSYNVTIRSTDAGGYLDHAFTITITDVAPTNISLDNASIPETAAVGTVVGNLSATASEGAGQPADTFTYSLVGGDTSAFAIQGSRLVTHANFDVDAKSSYSVTVRATDASGLHFDKSFTITITDVAPTNISLDNASIPETAAVGTVVGGLSATAPEGAGQAADTFTYSLVGGDTSAFAIQGSQLVTNTNFDVVTQPTYSVTVRAADASGLHFDKSFTITITDVAPTNINIDNTTVAESAAVGTVVANLSTTAPEGAGKPADIFTYSLVGGTTTAFAIQGSQLVTNTSFDIETQAAYSVTVRSTDALGLSVDRTFNITITDVPPTGINLDNTSLAENAAVGAVVGTLSTVVPDLQPADSFTYALVAGDTGDFAISGSQLVTTAGFDVETQASYSVTVRSTDSQGLSVDRTFTITITDVAPTDISLSNSSVVENTSSGTVVGNLSTTALEGSGQSDAFTYGLVAGAGDTNNADFSIQGNQLIVHGSLDEPSASIRVRTTDPSGQSFDKVFTITVTDPAVTAIGQNITGNSTGPVTVATFTDPAGPETGTGDYSASIDWGDGTTTAGTIANSAQGTFTVTGTHSYSQPGFYVVATSITHDSNSPTQVFSLAQVTPLGVEDNGQTASLVTGPNGTTSITIGVGDTVSFPASFSAPAAGTSWNIAADYGDNGSQNLVLTQAGPGNFQHIYSSAGNFIATITAADGALHGTFTLVVNVLQPQEAQNVGQSQTTVIPPNQNQNVNADLQVQGNNGNSLNAQIQIPAGYQGGNGSPPTVSVATYNQDPITTTGNNNSQVFAGGTSGGTGQDVNPVAFFDVRTTGITAPPSSGGSTTAPSPSLTVSFTFNVAAADASKVAVFYFDTTTSTLEPVISGADNGAPQITLNGDGTATVIITVTFNDQSTPKIWNLSGTVFTVAVPAPPPPPVATVASTASVASTSLTAFPAFNTTTFSSNSQLTLVLRVSQTADLSASNSTTGTGNPAAGFTAETDGQAGELADLHQALNVDFLLNLMEPNPVRPANFQPQNQTPAPQQQVPAQPQQEQPQQQQENPQEDSSSLESARIQAIDLLFAWLSRQEPANFVAENGCEWLVETAPGIDHPLALPAFLVGLVHAGYMPRFAPAKSKKRRPLVSA